MPPFHSRSTGERRIADISSVGVRCSADTSSAESNADIGDRANDAIRADGSELRVKVVGEGGNLGCTQRGRIEFARAGGLIYTDAIDNAGGVNCSDHEVNIKVLLDTVVADGDMTVKQRNALLAEMTDAVAERVLRGSYLQTQALSLARVDPHRVVGLVAHVGVRLRRRLHVRTDPAVPQHVDGGDQDRGDELRGGVRLPLVAEHLAHRW